MPNQMFYQVAWERTSHLLVTTIYQSSNSQSNSHVAGVLSTGRVHRSGKVVQWLGTLTSELDHPGLTRYQLNDCGQVTLHQPEPPLLMCKMGMTVAVAAVMK